MSSDVYIDLKDGDREDGARVGQLALMNYFEPKLLDCLRMLSQARPVLDSYLITIMAALFDVQRAELGRLRALNPEYVAVKFGYRVPADDGGDVTVWSGAAVEAYLREYIGWTWAMRVD